MSTPTAATCLTGLHVARPRPSGSAIYCWAILHPSIKAGWCPIVTFHGDEEEAREVLSPIIKALQRGDGGAALAAAEGA